MVNTTNRQYAPAMSQQLLPMHWFDTHKSWPEVIFIRRMKRERLRRGWSQERLAREVNEVAGPDLELHPTAITKLEREGDDRRNLRLNEAVFIADALMIRLEAMLQDEDQSNAAKAVREIERDLDSARREQAIAEAKMRRAAENVRELVTKRAEAVANAVSVAVAVFDAEAAAEAERSGATGASSGEH